ncbi:MAG: hypothetical protein ILP02_01575, partial [Clostridia bacterium]|nr:hypothetical protein [Clostridia bacterium]
MMNFYDAYQILSKVYSDGAYLKQAISDTRVEPSNKSKTIKICYGVLDKDLQLDYYIGKLCEKPPKLKIKIILKIGMYAVKYLENKPFAVIDALVELTKKLGKSANAGFVNAVLRKFVPANIPLPEGKIERLSVRYAYPAFAVERLLKDYGDGAEDIMAFDKEYTFVRFLSGFDGEGYLKDKGYTYEKTPYLNLFAVDNMRMDDDFYSGVYTFQSIGSVAICEAVGSGKTLLDACAAPGGKSVYLSDRFSSIVACDVHPHRVDLIKAYTERMGVKNVTAVVADSGEYEKGLGKFSAVLCDVPCSGYGTVKSNPDIKLRRSEKSLSDITSTQLNILSNCSRYVENEGVLVYSTCSVFDEENDEIISKFLENNDNFEI